MIEIYIGLRSGGWALDGRTQAWAPHADPAQGLEQWARAIGKHHAGRWRRARADLWLSGGIARPFLCGPLAGLKNWREAEAFAASVAPESTGLDGPCQVRLEGWPGDGPAICTALDADFAGAIVAIADACRIVWRSVRPRWAAALDDMLVQRPSTALVAIAEEDGLTLLLGAQASSATPTDLVLASTYSPAPDLQQASALWHRMMLSQDVRIDDAWLMQLAVPRQETNDGVPASYRPGAWPRLVQLAESIVS